MFQTATCMFSGILHVVHRIFLVETSMLATCMLHACFLHVTCTDVTSCIVVQGTCVVMQSIYNGIHATCM